MPPNVMWLSKAPNLFWFPLLQPPKLWHMSLVMINKISCILFFEHSLRHCALRPGYPLRTLLPIILDQSLEIAHFLFFLVALSTSFPVSSSLNTSCFAMHAVRLFTTTPFLCCCLLMSEPLHIPCIDSVNSSVGLFHSRIFIIWGRMQHLHW